MIEFTEIHKEKDYDEFLKDKGKIDTFSPEELKEYERLEDARQSINWDKLRQEKEYIKLRDDARKYNKLKKYLVWMIGISFFVALAILNSNSN